MEITFLFVRRYDLCHGLTILHSIDERDDIIIAFYKDR